MQRIPPSVELLRRPRLFEDEENITASNGAKNYWNGMEFHKVKDWIIKELSNATGLKVVVYKSEDQTKKEYCRTK